jgi:hypothetical protein
LSAAALPDIRSQTASQHKPYLRLVKWCKIGASQ